MPDLFPDLVPYWNAWIKLDGSRQVSFGGVGPIPVSEIRHYCDLVGIHAPLERKRTLRWVQLIDRTFLEVRNERDARDKSKKGAGGSGASATQTPPRPRRKRR